MVLPDSHGVSRVPRYSGTLRAAFDFAYEAFTLYDMPSQTFPLSIQITYKGPTTPHIRKHTVWANPISLAATLGISFDLFSSGY
jgi:hypothetical protein